MSLLINLYLSLFYVNVAYADFNSFLTNVDNQIINPIIDLMFALAIGFFLWGVLEFILNLSNDEKKTTGKSHMLWGVVGIAIMMGVFTIMNMVLNTLNVSGVDPANGTVQLDK